jgi:hypothetical protein
MNTIGLLLVLGLAFYALKHKSQKTRNMLLVVSALLGFCIFSVEGFVIAPGAPMGDKFREPEPYSPATTWHEYDDWDATDDRSGSPLGGQGSLSIRDGTPITVYGSVNRYIINGNDPITLDGQSDISTDITCKVGKQDNDRVIYNPSADASTWQLGPGGDTRASDMDTYLSCVEPTTACPPVESVESAESDIDAQNATCGPGKTYKTTISAADTYTGDSGETNYIASCCEDPSDSQQCTLLVALKNIFK